MSPSNFALELLGICTELTRRALAVHSVSTLGHMECCVDVISSPNSRRVKKSYWLDTRDNGGEQSVSNRRVVADLLFSVANDQE